MRKKQYTLLAGVAGLALFAASGIAAAQQTQDQKGAGNAAQSSSMQSQRNEQGAKSRTANQGMKNEPTQHGPNQHAMSRQSSGQNAQNESKMQSRHDNAGKMSNAGKNDRSFNRSAEEQNKTKGARTNRTAQGQQGQQKQFNAESRTTQSKNGRFATEQNNRTRRGSSTAQRNEQLNGLQGSTRQPMQGATEQGGRNGANVSLNDQQRTQIRDTIINSRSAPRINNPSFSVNVGTVVPRQGVHLVRVPQPLIRIHPGWRRFVYFVYNDEIVIVDPRTMRIVDVVSV